MVSSDRKDRLSPCRVLPGTRCTELAYSIYHLKATGSATRYGSYAAKTTAVILPILQVSLMRTDIVQSSTIVFYFLANLISESHSIENLRHSCTRADHPTQWVSALRSARSSFWLSSRDMLQHEL